MSKENYTQISVVMDRSGSMQSIARAVMNGLDEFVKGQKEAEGEATFTLAQFDSEYEIVYDMVDIKSTPNNFVLSPRGGTALLDAMGKTMNTVRSKILAMDEKDRPSKSIFVFITDGQENESKEYTREQIFAMIEDLKGNKDLNWEFVFMGANQDAIQAGGSFGIGARNSLTYGANGAGVANAFRSLTNNTVSYRSKGVTSYAFTDEDRKAQEDTSAVKSTNTKRSAKRTTNYSISGPLDINDDEK